MAQEISCIIMISIYTFLILLFNREIKKLIKKENDICNYIYTNMLDETDDGGIFTKEAQDILNIINKE